MLAATVGSAELASAAALQLEAKPEALESRSHSSCSAGPKGSRGAQGRLSDARPSPMISAGLDALVAAAEEEEAAERSERFPVAAVPLKREAPDGSRAALVRPVAKRARAGVCPDPAWFAPPPASGWLHGPTAATSPAPPAASGVSSQSWLSAAALPHPADLPLAMQQLCWAAPEQVAALASLSASLQLAQQVQAAQVVAAQQVQATQAVAAVLPPLPPQPAVLDSTTVASLLQAAVQSMLGLLGGAR